MFVSVTSFSQSSLPGKQISLLGGYGRSGTGDLPGFMFGAEYSAYFKEKISWAIGFGGFFYDGEDPDFITNNIYSRSNGSLRYTTAGLQVTGHIGFCLIRNRVHEIQLRPGVLVKYQSASLDGYSILYPVATGYPEPLVSFFNSNPQRTIAAGASAQAKYDYTIGNKISMGALAGIQTDTEGDLITQVGLTLRRGF